MIEKTRNFKDLVASWHETTLVILDIDSTLVLTHGRNQAILRDLAKTESNEFASYYQTLAQAECHPMEYGYGNALARLGLDEAPTEFLDEVQKNWRRLFFSNDYLKHDQLHYGALEFVLNLKDRSIPFVYLTGRYETTMRPGTLESLTQLGFPISDEILYLKPQPTDIDEVYKSERIGQLKQNYHQTVLIDNEPRVLNRIYDDHTDVDLIFVETCHSPNVTAPRTQAIIKDFIY